MWCRELTCTPAHSAFSSCISALGASSVRQVRLISLIPHSARALTRSPTAVLCPQDQPVAASAPLRQ